MISSSTVTKLLIEANNAAKQAEATRIFNAYVKQQEEKGHEPKRTRAAIKAIVTRKTPPKTQ